MVSPGQAALPRPRRRTGSVDFWVDDVDSAAAKALRPGGSSVAAAHDAPGFRRCVIADPQGATSSLSQLTMIR
jgi:predicted enzyme related to lactoylglutathione lyase